jgi:hypothetical protein
MLELFSKIIHAQQTLNLMQRQYFLRRGGREGVTSVLHVCLARATKQICKQNIKHKNLTINLNFHRLTNTAIFSAYLSQVHH